MAKWKAIEKCGGKRQCEKAAGKGGGKIKKNSLLFLQLITKRQNLSSICEKGTNFGQIFGFGFRQVFAKKIVRKFLQKYARNAGANACGSMKKLAVLQKCYYFRTNFREKKSDVIFAKMVMYFRENEILG